MSKKSKKILAYLMFVAALCGTPAVSEARGGSGGQVETEKASASQRGGNLSQSFISYLIKNYGFETAKWMLLGGGGFGTAKFLKAGDLSTWSSYLLNLKDAKSKDAEKLMKQVKEKEKKLKEEKNLFEASRAKAIKDNTKLNDEKVVLELNNNALNAKVKESEKKIEELKNSNAKLNDEVLGLKNYNNQLVNLNNEDNKKIDALLSGLLPIKMSGEFAESYRDNNWTRFDYGQMIPDPYSNAQGVVTVAFVNYDSNCVMIGKAEELKLGTDNFFVKVGTRAKELLGQDFSDANGDFKDVGLGFCDIPGLARCSFILKDENGNVKRVVAAYFPVKSFQVINNVENNENNENNNNENVENNVNIQNDGNENDININIDNNNMNNEMDANENNDINDENNENNDGNGN